MPEQDGKYRQKVYNALKGELGDTFTKTYDEFDAELNNNPEYGKKVYTALKGELGESFTKTPDEFYNLISVKKKVSTPGSQTASDTQSVSEAQSPSERPSIGGKAATWQKPLKTQQEKYLESLQPGIRDVRMETQPVDVAAPMVEKRDIDIEKEKEGQQLEEKSITIIEDRLKKEKAIDLISEPLMEKPYEMVQQQMPAEAMRYLREKNPSVKDEQIKSNLIKNAKIDAYDWYSEDQRQIADINRQMVAEYKKPNPDAAKIALYKTSLKNLGVDNVNGLLDLQTGDQTKRTSFGDIVRTIYKSDDPKSQAIIAEIDNLEKKYTDPATLRTKLMEEIVNTQAAYEYIKDNVKALELAKGSYTGVDPLRAFAGGTPIDEKLEKYKNLLSQYEVKKQALANMYFLNEKPEDIDEGFDYHLGILAKETGLSDDTKQYEVNRVVQEVAGNLGIELDEQDIEQLEPQFAEEVSIGTGAMLKMLPELALVETGIGALKLFTGLGKTINILNNGSKVIKTADGTRKVLTMAEAVPEGAEIISTVAPTALSKTKGFLLDAGISEAAWTSMTDMPLGMTTGMKAMHLNMPQIVKKNTIGRYIEQATKTGVGATLGMEGGETVAGLVTGDLPEYENLSEFGRKLLVNLAVNTMVFGGISLAKTPKVKEESLKAAEELDKAGYKEDAAEVRDLVQKSEEVNQKIKEVRANRDKKRADLIEGMEDTEAKQMTEKYGDTIPAKDQVVKDFGVSREQASKLIRKLEFEQNATKWNNKPESIRTDEGLRAIGEDRNIIPTEQKESNQTGSGDSPIKEIEQIKPKENGNTSTEIRQESSGGLQGKEEAKLPTDAENGGKQETGQDVYSEPGRIPEIKPEYKVVQNAVSKVTDKIRKGKIELPKDAFYTGKEAIDAWNISVEAFASSLEGAAKATDFVLKHTEYVAKSIQESINKLKETEWYKSKPQEQQKLAEESLSRELNKQYESSLKEGGVKGAENKRVSKVDDPNVIYQKFEANKPKSNWKKKAKIFWRNTMKASKNLPKDVFERNMLKEGAVEKEGRIIEDNVRKLQEEAKKMKLDNTQMEELIVKADKYLKGDKTVDLPDAIKESLNTMRDHIDSMSRKIKDLGILSKDMEIKFDENQGVYVTRSYEVFDTKNYAEKLPQEKKDIAVKWFEDNYPELTKEEIMGEINSLTDRNTEPLVHIAAGKLGKYDKGILKNRKDIPSVIRMLMGEYTDPVTNYVKSSMKMTQLLENAKMNKEISETGVQDGWLKETKEGDYYTPIKFNDKEYFTTKEITESFAQFENVKKEYEWYARTYFAINGFTKYAKTVLHPMTHARNFLSNSLIEVANANFDARNLKGATDVMVKEIFSKDKGKQKEFINELVRLKILGQSVQANELRAILEDARKSNYDVQKFIQNRTNKFVKGVKNAPTKLYAAEDSFWKVYAYLGELGKYKDVYKDNPEYMKDGEPTAKLREKVAEIVRMTRPTYDYIPEGVKKLRRFPVIGPFVSFQAEMMRTMYNTAELAVKEMKDPKTMTLGIKRIAALGFAQALPVATTAYFMNQFGISREDDYNFRKFLPEWSENGNILYLDRLNDNVVNAVDLSSVDPYSFLKKPVMAMMRAEDWEDGSMEALEEFFSPFIGEELLAGKLMDIARNKKGDGKGVVYNELDSWGDRNLDKMLWIMDAFNPGVVTQGQKIAKSITGEKGESGREYSLPEELLATFGGQRIMSQDIPFSFGIKISGLNKDLQSSRSEYNKELYQTETMTEESVENAYQASEEKRKKVFDQMVDYYQSAIKLGQDPDVLKKGMKDSGLTDEMVYNVANNQYIPGKKSDNDPYANTPQTELQEFIDKKKETKKWKNASEEKLKKEFDRVNQEKDKWEQRRKELEDKGTYTYQQINEIIKEEKDKESKPRGGTSRRGRKGRSYRRYNR